MADAARNRLVKKRDELEELGEVLAHVHGRIFFKTLTCSPGRACPDEVWQFVAGKVVPTQEKTTPVPFEIRTNRIDPFPGGSRCLWWWGDPKGVEKVCQWGDETAVALWEYRESLPELAPTKGYYRTLDTLCAVALEAGFGDPSLVVNRILLNADECPLLPSPVAGANPPVTFHVLDVAEDAVAFARQVLDHLLGNVPRLVVDLLGQNVVWKGQTFSINEPQALILDLLLKNLGKGPLTEKEMTEASPQLAGVNFNRTMRANLPTPLRNIVKSKRGQGWWLTLE